MTCQRQLILRLVLFLPLVLTSVAACDSGPSEAAVAARGFAKSSCAALQQVTDQLARPRPADVADAYYATLVQHLYTATNLAADAAQQDSKYQEFADTLHRAAETWQVTSTLDKAEPLIQQAREKQC